MAASNSNQVGLINRAAGTSTILTGADNNDIYQLRFSSDRKFLIGVEPDGTVYQWDLENDNSFRTWETDHHNINWWPVMSKDGNRLLTQDKQHFEQLSLWDLRTGKAITIKQPDYHHMLAMTGAALNSSGELAAIGSEVGNGVIWNLKSGETLNRLYLDDEVDIAAMDFSTDSKRLAYGGRLGKINILEVSLNPLPASSKEDYYPGKNSKEISVFPFRRSIEHLAFWGKSQKLLVRDQDNYVTQITIEDDKAKKNDFDGFSQATTAQAVSLDSKVIALAGKDGVVAINDPKQKPPLVANTLQESNVLSIVFSPGGKYLYSSNVNGAITKRDTQNWKIIDSPWRNISSPGKLMINQDGSKLIVASRRSGLYILDAQNGEILDTFSTSSPSENKIDATPLSSGSSGRINNSLFSKSRLRAVAMSPSGRKLIEYSYKEGLIQWDLTKKLWRRMGNDSRKLIDIRNKGVSGLVYSDEDKVIIKRDSTNSASIELVDPNTGKSYRKPLYSAPEFVPVVKALTEHLQDGRSISMSKDGRWLAAGSFNDSIYLWDLRSNELHPLVMEGIIREASSAIFNNSGSVLAAFDPGDGIVFWDVASQKRIGLIKEKLLDVNTLAISPNEKWIVGLYRGQIKVWPFGLTNWQTKACKIANRNLTQAEWNEYMGINRSCEDVCPELPKACD